MNKKAVLHIPMSQYAFALDEERMVFRLRTARGDMDACRLYYGAVSYTHLTLPTT